MSHTLRGTPAAAVALLLLLSLGTLACRDQSLPQLEPTRGVVLISIDTLRADHLSAYGYHRPTSPFIDELAARGVLFEQAIAQYPSTLTSHMSLFTGLYPGEHAVYPPDAVLSEEIPTLPEIYRDAGYRTGGFTEGAFMEGKFGFKRGFEVFDDDALRRNDDIERTMARASAFVESLGPEDRFFLLIHTYQPHDPYDPPEPYGSMFWEGEPPDTFAPIAPNMVEYNVFGGEVPPGTVDFFKARYDGSIRYTDDKLRELFGLLRERGLDQDLTVVLLSDHGEQFLEHGQFVHSNIYHHTIRVPLIVVHPALPRGTRVSRPVELVDVAPTLRELSALDESAPMSGRSLRADLMGQGPSAGTAYAEIDHGHSRSYYETRDDALYHLVVHRKPEDFWIGRQYTLDIPDSTDTVRLQSYQEPRMVRLLLDGEAFDRIEVPAEPEEIEVQLPAGSGRRVTLVAETCTALEDKQTACFAFRVREPETTLAELFEVRSDPLEQHDLAAREAGFATDLRRQVLRVSHAPHAAPLIRELEDSIEEELRGLGYL